MVKITVIIPTTGSKIILPFLRKCLRSLEAAASGYVELKIAIVSANPDLRKQVLKYQIDNFYLVDCDQGFPQMHNVAISESLRFYTSSYYLFINDDAYLSPNFFKNFLEVIKNRNPDLLNPLIYWVKPTEYSNIDSFGVEYFTSGYAKNAFELGTKTTLATAACLFVKTAFLQKMYRRYGFYFNSLLYYYLEDVEFSIRATAIGARIEKDASLIVYHHGSLSSGGRSYFTMYHTYKHILWLIILTWPLNVILRHLLSILLIQCWVIFFSIWKFGPRLYFEIIVDTVKNCLTLLRTRNIILTGYNPDFKFSTLLSNYTFRTRHGLGIRKWLGRFT